ncbi:MAG: PAS domain-containing protein, partial [Moraxella osloensis]|nr:PAS domain-containing protein [Moraxella osloensis]
MRNNQPITQEEFEVPQELVLVSKTDLKGNIIECNDAFEAASGYTRSELIGQPHNLIRHPDVPEAVFADMWASLKQGIPWTQLVKNRRKNGGFYWVRAKVTPIYKDEQIVGYMSVRSAITQAEKQAASEAYLAIKAGRAKIQYGHVYSGQRLTNPLKKISSTVYFIAVSLVLGLVPAVLHVMEVLNAMGLLASLVVMTLLLLLEGLKIGRQFRSMGRELKRLASGLPIETRDYDPHTLDGQIQNSIIASSLVFLQAQEESAYQLDKAHQLQTALDKMESNVMMADMNFNIIYMNEQLHAFLAARADKLKEVLPHFDIHQVIGSSIDVFHKNPAHQRAMMEKLTAPMKANINVAGFH